MCTDQRTILSETADTIMRDTWTTRSADQRIDHDGENDVRYAYSLAKHGLRQLVLRR